MCSRFGPWHLVTDLVKSSGKTHRFLFQKSYTGIFHPNRRLNRGSFPENLRMQDRVLTSLRISQPPLPTRCAGESMIWCYGLNDCPPRPPPSFRY